MKSILVKAQIQFDQFSDEDPESYVFETLNKMNSVLQERFPDITPQIFCNNIDRSDIETVDLMKEEEDEQ